MKVLTCDMKSETFTSDFVSSLRNTGFAVIVNHDIPKEKMDALYQKWAGVFADDKVKQIYLFDKQSQAGYFPFKSENAKGSTKKDLKEFWHIYCNRKDWKETVPLMSEYSVRNVFRPLEKLAIELLNTLEAQTPGENTNNKGWGNAVKGSDQTLFRILHYPPVGEGAEGVRAEAHEDINLITLLPSATAPGLQVKDASGNWHDVGVSEENAIIVNVGDMLQELTNGYYISTTHRVLNPTGEEALKPRYSAPLFLHPQSDFMLSSRHTANSYLMERLRELGLV